LAERAAGCDPQAEKQIAKRRIASEQVADLAAEFIARHASQNRTVAEITRILSRKALLYWSSWMVVEVRKRDVLSLFDRVRERGSLIMVNRLLATVRKFFNWCIGRGILDVSHCARVAAPARELARHRMLTDEELVEVLKASRKIGLPFGSIVEVLALTG
jgi:site-specific recombinase XerC